MKVHLKKSNSHQKAPRVQLDIVEQRLLVTLIQKCLVSVCFILQVLNRILSIEDVSDDSDDKSYQSEESMGKRNASGGSKYSKIAQSAGTINEEMKRSKYSKMSKFPEDVSDSESNSGEAPETSGSPGQEQVLTFPALKYETMDEYQKRQPDQESGPGKEGSEEPSSKSSINFDDPKFSENIAIKRGKDKGRYYDRHHESEDSDEEAKQPEHPLSPGREEGEGEGEGEESKEEFIGDVISGDLLPDDHEPYDYQDAQTKLDIMESQRRLERMSIDKENLDPNLVLEQDSSYWVGAPPDWENMEEEELEGMIKRDEFDQKLIDSYNKTFKDYDANREVYHK